MPKSTREVMNDTARKWAFVEAMSRTDLETLAAAVIERLCMTTEGQFSPSVDPSGADVCEELSTVLFNLGVSYSTLLTAKPRKPPAKKRDKVPAMRKALRAFIDTVARTGGITAHAEGPGTDVPVASDDWTDLAEAYKLACAAVGEDVCRTSGVPEDC